MGKAEATVDELVGMIQRGELRLPEMQRRYVWKSTRVRDLMDSPYRGYPSGTILLWESDEGVPLQKFSIAQTANPFHTTRLLLDGQQRLTSLSAVIRGEPIEVRGRRRPIDLLFNLNHPDELAVVTEVHEDADDDDEVLADETEASMTSCNVDSTIWPSWSALKNWKNATLGESIRSLQNGCGCALPPTCRRRKCE